MKLSLAWIFDHIDADWQSVSVEHIVETFNQTVAERRVRPDFLRDLTGSVICWAVQSRLRGDYLWACGKCVLYWHS